MKKTVAMLTVFIILWYIRFSMAEDDKVKLPPGYTPPFEYEARPILENHTKAIENIRSEITSLKAEFKKLKDSVASISKSPPETKFILRKFADDLNALKNEIGRLKEQLDLAKQESPVAPPAKSLEVDIKVRLETAENNIRELKNQLNAIEKRLSSIEETTSR